MNKDGGSKETVLDAHAGSIAVISDLAEGLCGLNEGTINASFWDRSLTGGSTEPGSEGVSTSSLHDPNTFLQTGWDFVGEHANGGEDLWKICAWTSYPRLAWEPSPAVDVKCPDGVGLEDLLQLAAFWLGYDNALDLWPIGGGDGVINLQDYGLFQQYWLQQY